MDHNERVWLVLSPAKGMGEANMKTTFGIALLLLSATAAAAQYGTSQNGLYGHGTNHNGLSGTGSNPSNHYVQPHATSSGAYTSGNHQTNPNNTQMDNYSTRGNVNPYTGAVGTRTPRY
jgi:hypothetical protein